MLGADYSGFLVRDGWGVYRQFIHAYQQTCLAHLLRRCRELRLVLGPRSGRFSVRVQSILQQSLRLRDRRDQKQISPHGLVTVRGRLEAQMDRLLQADYRCAENRRFANHLRKEQDALFTFLYCPGLEATNWRAEQAIRPMVVTRKVWGGNRTPAGARTQSILVSILQTCRQQGRRSTRVLQELLCSPLSKTMDLSAPRR